jgi:hypothetical protein
VNPPPKQRTYAFQHAQYPDGSYMPQSTAREQHAAKMREQNAWILRRREAVREWWRQRKERAGDDPS